MAEAIRASLPPDDTELGGTEASSQRGRGRRDRPPRAPAPPPADDDGSRAGGTATTRTPGHHPGLPALLVGSDHVDQVAVGEQGRHLSVGQAERERPARTSGDRRPPTRSARGDDLAGGHPPGEGPADAAARSVDAPRRQGFNGQLVDAEVGGCNTLPPASSLLARTTGTVGGRGAPARSTRSAPPRRREHGQLAPMPRRRPDRGCTQPRLRAHDRAHRRCRWCEASGGASAGRRVTASHARL